MENLEYIEKPKGVSEELFKRQLMLEEEGVALAIKRYQDEMMEAYKTNSIASLKVGTRFLSQTIEPFVLELKKKLINKLAGALIMKKALVILDKDLQELGLIPGQHYEFVANIHDEFQIEVNEDKAELVGQTAQRAIQKAGEYFEFLCPLDGEYKVGKNWKETH